MSTPSKTRCEPTLAATVSGEDIACGDYVSVLSQTYDVPSYFWECSATLSPHELVRLKIIPASAGLPHKVIAICLPFVYVKPPQGETVTLDMRRMQLVRLDRRMARVVWKSFGNYTKA